MSNIQSTDGLYRPFHNPPPPIPSPNPSTTPRSTLNIARRNIPAFPADPFSLPWLVLPSTRPIPECPFDVANTAGSIVTVFSVLVGAVVANVRLAAPAVPVNAPGVRNTSAAPGAGTRTVHTLVPVAAEHDTVCTLSVPMGRPSEVKVAPNVCPAQV